MIMMMMLLNNTVWVLGVALFGNGVQVVGAVLQVGRPLWDRRGMTRNPGQNGDSKGCACVCVCALTVQSRTAFSAGL